MTDYGRGSGSEPWHPEDPLYGDQGWAAQQAPQGDQDPRYYDQGAQGQYAQQQPYAGGNDPYQQQPFSQQGQQVQQGYETGQQYQQHYPQQQSYPQQQPEGQQYAQQQYPYQQYPQQYAEQQHYPEHPGQGYDSGQGYDNGQGYDSGQGYGDGQGYGEYGSHGDYDPRYGQHVPQQYVPQGQDAYQQPQQYGPGHGGGWDAGGPQQAVPQQAAPEPEPEPAAEAAHDGGWDDEPQEETHPFFTGEDTPLPRAGRRGDADDDSNDDDGDEAGYEGDYGDSGPGKKRKGRSGAACLVIAVVLAGGLGGAGYFGYTFYQEHFGPPPDYAGSGTGTVQVTIPDGSSGSQIAALLVKSGVVKSTGAFVVAQNHDPKGNTIQAGVYTLKKKMSGKSAVTLMLSPKSRTSLIIPEGTRDATVYAMIDKQLKLKAGTTKSVAFKKAKSLGLPSWADDGKGIKDPLEGFLFPASYPVGKSSTPEDVLKKMVARATAEYDKYGLPDKAKSVGLDNPWQLLTVASLVQAEGKTKDDFRKIAEVIYNRLDPATQGTNQRLQLDSTYNYLKGQSNIDISESAVNSNHDPYNTYTRKGLPPGPIDNPGEDAISAVLDPTNDGWLYFVATDGNDKTEFAKTSAGFQQLKQKFNNRKKGTGG